MPHKHFLNSFDKKQLINILVGGIRYFFYLWLTSSKPKHKKDKREKKEGDCRQVILKAFFFCFSLLTLFGEIIGLEILGRKKVMSNEKEQLCTLL